MLSIGMLEQRSFDCDCALSVQSGVRADMSNGVFADVEVQRQDSRRLISKRTPL